MKDQMEKMHHSLYSQLEPTLGMSFFSPQPDRKGAKFCFIFFSMKQGIFISGMYFFFFIWLHWVLVGAGGLLSCGSLAPQLWHGGSLVVAHGLLVAAHGILSCGMRTLSCGMHVGSSSLTRDRNWAPCVGSAES